MMLTIQIAVGLWLGALFLIGTVTGYCTLAEWPVVIWCRLMRHRGQGVWHTPNRQRCIGCGDYVNQ